MPEIIIETQEEETEPEVMEVEEWRSLLVSVVSAELLAVKESLSNLNTQIQVLSERVPDQSLLRTLLETNSQQNSQILGSQTRMLEILTPPPLPEPIVLPEPEPESVAEVAPEEVVPEPSAESKAVPKRRRI